MAEIAIAAKADSPPAVTDVDTGLEALRAQGGQRWDPIRFHFMETLAQRAGAQPETVRRVLDARLRAVLADYTQGWQKTGAVAPERPAPVPPSGTALAALHGLNQRLRADAPGEGAQADTATTTSGPLQMKSVRAFQQTWLRIRMQDRLEAALRAGPESAGPLNSHMLVLRSLDRMRAIAPAYLQRFVSHVDTLLCLDKLGARPGGATPTKPTRAGRSRK